MAQKGSTQATKLYRRGENNIWYFKYTNGSGKRVQRSTGTADRREALRFQKRFLELAGRNRSVNTTDKSFRDIARLFLDPETNPRRREALVAKKSYGMDHARNVARHTSYLIDICDRLMPGILDRPVAELGRRDIKDIAEAIVADRGSCRTSQQVFQACKTILSQAASDDLVLVSPGTGISNIQYKEKQKISIHEQDIVWLLDHEELFPSHEFWAFTKVLATTVMLSPLTCAAIRCAWSMPRAMRSRIRIFPTNCDAGRNSSPLPALMRCGATGTTMVGSSPSIKTVSPLGRCIPPGGLASSSSSRGSSLPVIRYSTVVPRASAILTQTSPGGMRLNLIQSLHVLRLLSIESSKSPMLIDNVSLKFVTRSQNINIQYLQFFYSYVYT